MAMKPKKSDSMQTWGAGSSGVWKSGTKAKVPNPNGDKLIPVKPKPAAKSVMPKVTPKPVTKKSLEVTPKVTKKDIAKQMVSPKASLSDMAKRVKANPTAKAKPKLSKSEADFIAGQKLKAKITKKTGVYPNTAN